MNFAKKLIGTEDERAVSPVIGVILMVAITVILAAVIAAFVLNLGDTSQPASANFDITEDAGSNTITATVTNADRIDRLRINSDCSNGAGTYYGTTADFTQSVGATFDITQLNCDDGDELRFVAVYDGSEEVVRTYEIGHGDFNHT